MATGSAAARAGRCWPSCSWPSVRRPGPDSRRCCSRRPTTRCERCVVPGGGPAGTRARCRARRRPGAADAAAGAVVDVDVLVHGHWNDALKLPGSGRTCSTASMAQPSRSGPGCCPSAGGCRRPRSRSCTRPPWGCWRAASSSGRASWSSRRGDEPAGREPPGAADPPLPAGRRRRGGRAASSTAWSATAARELGTSPGAAVIDGPGGAPGGRGGRWTPPSIHAVTEAGAAAVSAGALVRRRGLFEQRCGWPTRPGAVSLRVEDPSGAGRGADPHVWAASTRQGLAAADRGGADRARAGRRGSRWRAPARSSGYVDFLRARCDRSERLARPGPAGGRGGRRPPGRRR